MNITFPETTDIIDKIRGAIGRDVTFYTVTYSGCFACELDPVTNTSTDSFCPVCSGEYWIPAFSGYTMSGHITWGNSDQMNWVVGGQFFEGSCRLQVKYDEESFAIVNQAEYVVVDGIKMRIDKKGLRGTKELNRVVLTLSQEEKI